MSEEKRKQTRHNIRCDVIINDSIKGKGLDISEGGMYVYTGRMFDVGSTIDVAVPGEGESLKIKAEVQHATPGIGMGLMFVELTSERQDKLKGYLESLSLKLMERKRKKVLLVDESDSSRRTNKSKLILDGLSVLEAKDGQEALNILQREAVDAMVLDPYVKKFDGFKLLNLIRQTPEWENIPVIVLSARGSSEEIEKAMSAGANEFLPKMFTSPVKLSAELRALLGK